MRDKLTNVVLHLIVEAIGRTAPASTTTRAAVSVALVTSAFRFVFMDAGAIGVSCLLRALLVMWIVAGHGVLLFVHCVRPEAATRRVA